MNKKRRYFKNQQSYWRAIFKRVMAHYEEASSVAGTMSCSPFYQSLESGARSAKFYNPRVLKPSLIDFIADVELVAKSVLDDPQYQFFYVVHIQQILPDAEVCRGDKFRKMDKKVREQVGKAFIAFYLYPIQRYFATRSL